jgi:soluble lytic murein transglycosylase
MRMHRVIVWAAVALVAAGCGGGSLLERIVTPSSRLQLDTPSEKRAAFARAYESFQRGDLAKALPIFEQLVPDYPELADYDLYFVGVINQRSGHANRAEAAFSRLLRDYPDSVQAPAAALALGELLIAAGRIDQGRLSLWTALNAPDPSTAEAARLVMAEADERSGDITSAYAQYMQVRRAVPGTAVAQTAKRHVMALRAAHPELVPTGGALLDEARLLLTEKDYAGAKAAATQLSEEPDGRMEPTEVLRVIADALYGLGETERALAVLRELAVRYPDTAAAPDAWFQRATILWNRDRDAEALRSFEELRSRYPQAAHAVDALYAIGRIHQQAGRSAAATAAYRELATRYPRSKLAGEAQWRIGWMQYQAGSWTAAAGTFGQLARQDQLRDEAEYWQGRALQRAGRSAASRPLYRDIVQRNPGGYYAMWAQRRLSAASSTPLLHDTATVAAPAPPVADPPQVPDAFHLVRAGELKAAGISTLARKELAATERAYDYDVGVQRYLVRAYQTVDAYTAALRLARRLGNQADLSPSEEQQLRYPLAFWNTVRHVADAQDVDPLLVVAIIRQESMFDPTARSSADARGLMQLLPSTAERVAAASEPPIDHTNLMDPDINIELGTRYLRTLLTRFGGDPLKAIAAYNGGDKAVAKWQRQFADLADDEFVESITYRETRDYVKRVVGNYRTYQQQYGGAAQ